MTDEQQIAEDEEKFYRSFIEATIKEEEEINELKKPESFEEIEEFCEKGKVNE